MTVEQPNTRVVGQQLCRGRIGCQEAELVREFTVFVQNQAVPMEIMNISLVALNHQTKAHLCNLPRFDWVPQPEEA